LLLHSSRPRLKHLPLALSLAGILVLSGCHKKVPPPATPPPPTPPLAQPTATISANPTVLNRGGSTTLAWNTTNATSTSISGIGPVPASGTQNVSPTDSATFTLTAKGGGGSVDASVEVTVNRPSAPPPAPAEASLTEQELFDQNVKDVYFNYDKDTIRAQDEAVVDADAAFLKQHPDLKILIGGHCDERGSAEYNLALGETRAENMQRALVTDGVPASRIRAVTYGKERPFCTEETESCWQENRRDHLTLDK
jgi:peptidoglycan-associated lipoprotein